MTRLLWWISSWFSKPQPGHIQCRPELQLNLEPSCNGHHSYENVVEFDAGEQDGYVFLLIGDEEPIRFHPDVAEELMHRLEWAIDEARTHPRPEDN